MHHIFALSLSLLGLASSHIVFANATFNIEIDNPRKVFYRGESISLPITVTSSSDGDQIPASTKMVVRVDDVLVREFNLEENGRQEIQIETDFIHSGKYQLSVELIFDQQVLGQWERAIELVAKPKPDRLDLWLWSCGGHYTQEMLRWWSGCGFTNFAVGVEGDVSLTPEMQADLENVLSAGLTACIMPNGGMRDGSPAAIDDPDMWLKDYDGNFVKSGTYGNDTERMLNPFHPKIAKWHTQLLNSQLGPLSIYPQISTAFFNTEIVDDLPLSANVDAKARLQKSLDFLPKDVGVPEFVRPGVLSDEDRAYRLMRYKFKEGNGLTIANKRIADIVHQHLPNVITINDPFRYFSMLDCFPGIDAVSSWSYTNPDPKGMLFIETLRAACRHSEQIPLHVITMYNYPGQLTTSDEATMMGPDRYLETMWINLSRAPKMVGVYFSSLFDPFKEKSKPESERMSEETFPSSTFQAARRIATEVIRPYGPFLSRARVAPRRVAVLSSDSSRLHGKNAPLPGHYANLQIYHFYTLLAMAHLPADVIFEDSLEHISLNDYDVLVLPKCEVLPESVVTKILDFQQQGGLVVADQYLGPEIPGSIRFDFDFTYRDRVSAIAIAKGQTFADWNDRLKPDTAKLEAAQGVTALDDQRIMASYANELRTALDGKVARSFDCDTETALISELQGGNASYLVVINDKRKYSPRLLKYQSLLDELVPQTVTITAHNWSENELHPYDLLQKKALPVEKLADGKYQFKVELTDIGGTIIALQPKAIYKIDVVAPKRLSQSQRGQIKIKLLNGDGGTVNGLQPIQLKLIDHLGNEGDDSGYYCLENGEAIIEFPVALNDEVGIWKVKVEDLTSGLKQQLEIDVVEQKVVEKDKFLHKP
jgi:hypothetical protein